MDFTYRTHGTCSRSIYLSIDSDDCLTSVSFEGGCNGNLKGISALCLGMKVDEVISRLENIKCGMKQTSCPDQLACALKEYKQKKGE